MDPNTGMVVEMLGACGYALSGLVLIIIGAVSARPAHPPAGYLAIAAGALMLLHGCCNVVPDIALRATGDYETAHLLYMGSGWAGFLFFLIEALMLLAAPILLARAALARGGAT